MRVRGSIEFHFVFFCLKEKQTQQPVVEWLLNRHRYTVTIDFWELTRCSALKSKRNRMKVERAK